jgi:glyoxylase-like metal-dependent hydrolase (beta-lactamase superfamily II)
LVDAGCGRQHSKLTANIQQCLPQTASIDYLLLTHCHFDHVGGAEAVRRTYGCKIVAHAMDAAFLEAGDSEVTAASWYGTTLEPLRIDVKLQGAENTIAVGENVIKALHWPGHSPGSLVYSVQLGNQLILFGQDVHGPLHPSLKSDPVMYRKSLQKLCDLQADILLEGHYGVITGKQAVEVFIRSFMN